MALRCNPTVFSSARTTGSKFHPLALTAALALSTALSPSAQAATNTFQAGTSWNTVGDWSAGHTPIAADALFFNTFVPATTTLDNAFTADTLSFNTANTMAIDANASVTTARTLTLNNTTTNANGTSDILSLLGGGTINIGVTASKGVLTTALVAASNNINVANGGSLVFGTNSVISGTSKALSFTGNSTGMLTLSGANTFSGGFTLTSGVVRATNSTGALGAGTLSLGGGELQLANATGLNFNRATTVTANTQVTSDLLASGAGVTHTLNTLSIGAQTLTVAGGGNVTSGTAGVTFGTTTLTGNSTFNVTNPSGGGGTTLILGALNDGGATARTLTKSGNGTLSLGTAPTSLIAGTQLIVTGGTLNQSVTNALGTNNPAISITPTSGTATYNLSGTNITQTIGALTLGGASGTTATIAAPAGGKVTLAGNLTYDAASNPNGATIAGKLDVGTSQKTFAIGNSTAAADDLTISAVLTNGASGSLLKTGAGTLVLSGASTTYSGGIALNQGTLVATTSTGALGANTSTLTFGGGNLELRNDTGLTFTTLVNAASSGGTITVNRATSAATATTHGMGTLALGAQTLSITPGANITSGTAYGLTFGATTLSGNGTLNISNNGAGTGTVTLAAVTDGGNRLTLAGDGNFAQSAAWAAGSGGGLTLGSGYTGTAILNQNNLNTGGVIINGGTLQLGNNNGLGNSASSTVTFGAGSTGKLQLSGFNPTIIGLNTNATVGTPIVENGHASTASTLTVNNASASTYAGVLQNGGAATLSLTKTGAGTLALSGANTYTGATSISAGAISVSNIGSVASGTSNLGAGSNTLNLGSGSTSGTLAYTGTGETTDRVINLSGSSGGGVLDQSGTGLLKFTGSPTEASGAKTLTLQGSTAGTGELSGVISNTPSGTLGINKAGSGTWTLSGTNTYTGNTTLTGGNLAANTAAINGGTATGNLVFNGGTLQATTGGITTGKNVSMTGNGAIDSNGNSVTLTGVITTGAFTLSKNGSGSLTLRANNNLNTGGIALNAGTLNLNDNAALGNGTGFTGTFTINGGSIDNTSSSAVTLANGNNVWNGDFSYLGTKTLDLGLGNVSLGTAAGTTRTITTNGSVNQALTVSGAIANGTTANSLTKAGTGALTLLGNNTYSGLTTVSAGTLTLSGANTGAGGVKVDGGTVIIGNATGLGTGSLTMNGGTVDVTSAQTVSNTQVWNGDFSFGGNSNLTLTGGTVSLGTAAGTSRTINIAASQLTVNGVISNGTTATALVKTGNGDLELTATNTFSGGLTFGSGTLWLSSAGSVGTGVLTLNDGAILDNYFAAGITTTNSGLVINGDFSSLGRQTLLTLGSGGSGNLGTAAGTTRTISAQGGGGRVLAINTNLANGSTATGIIKAGIGDLSLGGNNTFTGGVTVNEGRLNVHNAGALGTGTLTINGGELSNVSGALVTNSNNNAQVWNSDLIFSSTATGGLNLGTGAVSLGTTAGTTRTLNIAANSARILTVGGAISNGTTATGIVKTGAGTVTLAGNNTYTGTTTVNNGTANFTGTNSGGAVLVTGNIDAGTAGIMNVTGTGGTFTNTTAYTVNGGGSLQVGDATTGLANRLNTGATLSLGGFDGPGTFNMIRGSTTANTQSLVSLTVGDGLNSIGVSGAGGGIPTLTFSGATPYTRTTGGFVNFAPSTSLVVNFTNAPTGTGNVAAGLLVGGVVNGNDFIKAQSGALTLASYTANAWSSGNNTNVTATTDLSGTPSLTTGSLRFNTAGNQTVTLAGANTIQSGGIIVGSSSTVGNAATITGGTLQTGAAGGDLWMYVNNARTLTINSGIADNSGSSLTVAGTGTIILAGTNTYTGRTSIGTSTTLSLNSGSAQTLNNVQGNGTISNINTSGALTLNQTDSGLSLATVSGVSGSTITFSGTGDTTIKNALNSPGQMVNITGGTVNLSNTTIGSNVTVNGGTLIPNSVTINTTSGTQTLNLSSGQLAPQSHFVARANGSGATFAATQSGGTFSLTGASQFQLGINTATSSTSSYTLSGGTLSHLGTGGMTLYADTTGNSTSTFNLSGGTLLSAEIIQGNQGTGAKQAFVWTGGTLSAFSYDASKLTSSAGTAVSGSTNILTNGGGTLAPGGIGTAGKTVINGNYAVTSANAALAIDIGGSSAATAFQQSNRYDVVTVSGTGTTATLDGKLLVSLIGGFNPTATQQYTVLTATGGITGAFTNTIADAFSQERIVLSNGLSSFTITYGANSVVLDNYFADNEWYGNGSPVGATWSEPTNWSVFLPSMAGHTAKFGDNFMSGAQDVVLDTDLTIGGIQFNNTGSQYTIMTETDNGLTLDNNGAGATISSVGSHTINVPLTLATDLTVSASYSNSLAIGGVISGSGKSLTKTGAGTVTLTGDNTYTGGTTVSDGTLIVNNLTGSALGTGAVSVAAAGTLGGFGTVSNATTIAGTLRPGISNGSEIMTFTNSVTLLAGSTVNVEINGSDTRGIDYAGIDFNGALTATGINLTFNISAPLANDVVLNIFDGASFTPTLTSVLAIGTGGYFGYLNLDPGNTTYSATFGEQKLIFNLTTGEISLMLTTPIPEPSTVAALAGIIALFGASLRRRNLRS